MNACVAPLAMAPARLNVFVSSSFIAGLERTSAIRFTASANLPSPAEPAAEAAADAMAPRTRATSRMSRPRSAAAFLPSSNQRRSVPSEVMRCAQPRNFAAAPDAPLNPPRRSADAFTMSAIPVRKGATAGVRLSSARFARSNEDRSASMTGCVAATLSNSRKTPLPAFATAVMESRSTGSATLPSAVTCAAMPDQNDACTLRWTPSNAFPRSAVALTAPTIAGGILLVASANFSPPSAASETASANPLVATLNVAIAAAAPAAAPGTAAASPASGASALVAATEPTVRACTATDTAPTRRAILAPSSRPRYI